MQYMFTTTFLFSHSQVTQVHISVVSYTWTPEYVRVFCFQFVGTVLFLFSRVKIAKVKQVVGSTEKTDFTTRTLIFTNGSYVILYVLQCHGVTEKEKKEINGRKETH